MSEVICAGCGGTYEARRRSKYGYCPVCAAAAKRASQDRWHERQKVMAVPLKKAVERGVRSLTVVTDPLEFGGFRAGAQFSQDEWQQMLRLSSFSPGTVLRDGQGRLYEYEIEKDIDQ